MRKNIRLTIAYDGNAYYGWAKQKDVPSIQEQLEDALSSFYDEPVNVCGASRTDAGVHSLGQTANYIIDSPVPVENIAKALNNILPNDIAILEAQEAPLDFDPIGSPVKKHYRYTINTSPAKPVFNWRTIWHYPYPLSHERMALAAKRMEGTKDYKSFASAKDYRTDSIRTIYSCTVTRHDDTITVDVVGNRFMYNMVRNMVGTLVEVGRGRWPESYIDEIFEAKNRAAAGLLAPPNGLCLMKIYYP
ncbi:MAG: tRNA pseudouridine(38-40) synthase TruA [Phycisphaerae bacterium]|jgi:tRNA pseudouridine38-40 synthase